MRKRIMSTRELRAHERETKKSEHPSGSKRNKSVDKTVVTSPRTSSKKVTSARKAAKSSIDFVSPQKTDNTEKIKSKKTGRNAKPINYEVSGQFENGEKLQETRAEIRGIKKRGNKRGKATAATLKVDKVSLKVLKKSNLKETTVAEVTKTKKKFGSKKNSTDLKVGGMTSEAVDRRRSLRTKTSSVNIETITESKSNKDLENKAFNSEPTEAKTSEVSGMGKGPVNEQKNVIAADSTLNNKSIEVVEILKSNKVPVQMSKIKKKCDNKQENTAAAKAHEETSVVLKKRGSLRTKILPEKAEAVIKVKGRKKRVITKTVEAVDSEPTKLDDNRVLDVKKAVDTIASPVLKETYLNKQESEDSLAITKLGAITMRRPQKKVESQTNMESKISLDRAPINCDGSVLPLETSVPANIPNTSKSIIRPVEQTERRSTVPKSLPRNLRHRALQNYAESSLEGSKTEDGKPEKAQQNNVPIYKRKLEENQVLGKKKGATDLYEFDSDIEDGAKKKKKRKLDDSSYDEYNKTVSNLMKKVKNKQAKKAGKSAVKNPDFKQKVLKNNAESRRNLDAKPKVTNPNAKLLEPKTKNNRKQNCHAVSTDVMNNVTVKLVPLKLDTIKDNVQVLHAEEKLDLNKNKEVLADDSDGGCSDHNFDNLSLGNCADEDSDEFLPPIIMGSDRIHVLNNVLLNPSKSVVSPWRFSQRNVTRNPHFITLKPSALPAVNQEMVLDHTMVDKFDELSKTRCEKTPPDSTITKRSAVVQTTVTDFFKASSTQLKENPRLSLFDCEDFSPIKNPVSNASLNVEARSPVTRKILTENVNPNQMASTPIREVGARNLDTIDISAVRKPVDKDARDIESCFGFDSDDEQDESAATPKATRKSAKPFRLSGNVVMRRYERKEKPKTVPEVSKQIVKKPAVVEETTEKASEDVSSESDSEGSEIQSTIPEVGGIFQDLSNAENDLRQKEPKQKKFKWLAEDDKILKFKKNRKDVRTKEEEEEAEKWAADFNSMCEEIDQYDLEIE